MLSTKKSAQTLVLIAFFPFITIPNAKSGLLKCITKLHGEFAITIYLQPCKSYFDSEKIRRERSSLINLFWLRLPVM